MSNDTDTVTVASTATTDGARDHARAQEGRVVEHMPTIPATGYQPVPDEVDAATLVWAERVAPGGYTHRRVAAGTTVRLADPHGDACAHLLLYRADEPWERLNVADTVKVQWQAYLHAGQLLLSDQGRVLASIIGDTSAHHDAICGTSTRVWNERRYGAGEPGSATPAGRDLLILAAAKHGLGVRDIPPSVSFFQAVRVDPMTGQLVWAGSEGPSWVTLRAELPLIVLIANTTHPIDPRAEFTCSTLEVLAWPGPPTALDEWPANASPEAGRAFLNNHEELAARGGEDAK
jgi:hypothetical protein